MILHRVHDWDDAYANGPNIAHGERWPDAWVEPARLYRKELAAIGRARLDLPYGDRTRNRLDLFMPAGEPVGLVIFIHGGFWMRLDKSFWSHLARGALEQLVLVAWRCQRVVLFEQHPDEIREALERLAHRPRRADHLADPLGGER